MATFYATAKGNGNEIGKGGTAASGVNADVSNGLYRFELRMYRDRDGVDFVCLQRRHLSTGRIVDLGRVRADAATIKGMENG